MKTYTRRDSVTSILRKMGIDKTDYNNHIITNDDGTFSIKEQDFTPPCEESAIAETTISKPKELRRTVSSAAREHILAGYDNKKIFELLQAEFQLDDSKKNYPGWYRADMKRKGLLEQGGN